MTLARFTAPLETDFPRGDQRRVPSQAGPSGSRGSSRRLCSERPGPPRVSQARSEQRASKHSGLCPSGLRNADSVPHVSLTRPGLSFK